MATATNSLRTILTPDQRLRVFISALPGALPAEHAAAVAAIELMHLFPVTARSSARASSAEDVVRSYVQNSDIFVGIYGGDAAPHEPDDVAALEAEYRESAGKPRLLYVKRGAVDDPALSALLAAVRDGGDASYRHFESGDDLARLLTDDLAVLLSERFAETTRAPGEQTPSGGAPRPSLPLTPTSFIGRDADVQHVTGLLRDPDVRLVTIVGPGGVGKTRLALEAGARMADDFPDGAAIVWLDAITDPTVVLQLVAAELHVKETSEDSVLSALANRLRGTRMLVILDNFEHVMPAATLVAELLSFPTGSKILVTSRELLHIRGEHPVVLEPLGVPADDQEASLTASEAVALFVDRAAAAAPGFAMTPDNAPAIAAIVRRLEGVPLALELAAARVRVLSPAALLDRLTHALDLPGAAARDLPARQQTLRSTIDWSYQLLDDAERQALERLSVFPAGATLDAVVSVLEGVGDSDPLALVESLLRKSLVRRTEDDQGEARLGLLVAIRTFAGEKLAERGDHAATRDRHAAFYAALTAAAAPAIHSAEQAQQLAQIDDALENIAAALGWYAESGQTDAALRISTDLRWYWIMRGHLTAAARWMARLLELPPGNATERGHALTTAGMIAQQMGEMDRARGAFEGALELLDPQADPDGVAWAWTGLGAVLHATGSFTEAEQLQEQALTEFRRVDDLAGQCTANTRVACLLVDRGDYGVAERRFEGSLAVRRKIKDPWGTSTVLTALASLRLLAGDLDQAARHLTEALELTREIDHRDGMARALDNLGLIDVANERWDDARAQFDEAVRLYSDVGNRPDTAVALAHLAMAELHGDLRAQAGEHAVAAHGIAHETGDARALVAAADAIGCIATMDGEHEAAAEVFAAADAIRRERRIPVPPVHAVGPQSCRVTVASSLEPAVMAAVTRRAEADPAAAIRLLAGRVGAAHGRRGDRAP